MLTVMCQNSHYWRNRLMEQAKHYRSKTQFTLSRVTEYEEELTTFGLISEVTLLEICV